MPFDRRVKTYAAARSNLPDRPAGSGILILDADHYDLVIARAVREAHVSVWISTANLKTMLVEAPIGSRARARGRFISFFDTLADLVRRDVDVRVLHAAPPSRPLQKELTGIVPLRQCPRVHLKLIAIDGRLLYLGSANLTGAGLGAKADGRRNFEMGLLTESEALLDAAQERFDRIWRGAECGSCKLRSTCAKPLDTRPKLAKATSRGGSTRARRSLSLLR